MTRFAFIIHPLHARDAARKYPIARFLPEGWIESLIRRKDPMVVSHITGIRSKTGAETEGWFIGCPLTPRQMTGGVPLEEVYDKIAACAELGRQQGADVVGLGAFTAVAGDGGFSVAKRSKVAITTGNSYTVATAIQGTERACDLLEIDRSGATLAVIGATGSIGKTCARVLGRTFGRTLLIGRDAERTARVAEEIPGAIASTELSLLKEADAIVTVTSSESAIVLPEHLRPGAIVCDVSRPRDVSVRVARERPDVLVIEGGVVKVPGNVEFGFQFGFPPQTAYACMSETMLLALEGRAENYTLGKEVSVAQVDETRGWADKHGFELAGFRSFERAVDEETIARVKQARSHGRITQPAPSGALNAS